MSNHQILKLCDFGMKGKSIQNQRFIVLRTDFRRDYFGCKIHFKAFLWSLICFWHFKINFNTQILIEIIFMIKRKFQFWTNRNAFCLDCLFFQCIFSSFHISSLKVDHQGKLHAINPDHHHPSDPWFCPLSQDSSCIGFPTSITNKKSAARWMSLSFQYSPTLHIFHFLFSELSAAVMKPILGVQHASELKMMMIWMRGAGLGKRNSWLVEIQPNNV